ncbi:RND transporter [Vulcanimicrobium alpinum]|uniref:RND transporter n=1 Tax=Vulcanimicrobium alpinum TaxID=3016050 RepID=A0AAN1XZ76_UNVUL|nr:efflux RND transporter periplasmic adaptor subunit [Vulcanimicrobium alpinum]BDE08074.1 RND transporter [Vulcanimicrobium alpinum]
MSRTTPLALAAAGALVLGGCAARAASVSEQPPTPVTLATAAAPPAQSAYDGPGTVVPRHVYKIAFEVPGRIATVNADVGDRVAAGTVLAALDGGDYAAQARGADAQAAQAAATAAKARNGARTQERQAAADAVAAALAQRDRALAAQRLALANKARYDALFAGGDVAAQQHDQTLAAARDADAAVNAANAQYEQARAQQSLVRSGTRDEDLRAAAAVAEAARASADLAGVTLAKTRIVAPADAYVESRAIEPGSTAQPGATAFVLDDAREPDIVVAVPEARMAGIAAGTPATIRANGAIARGRVERVEPDADPASRTAQVRIRTSGLRLRDGAIVDVALGSERTGGTAAVPLGAVVTDAGGGSHVLLYDARTKTAALRAVRVVGGDGERAIVRGVAPGTRVVRGGAALVKPGAQLAVVPE